MIGTVVVALLMGLPLGLVLWRQVRRIRVQGGRVPVLGLAVAAVVGAALGAGMNRIMCPMGAQFRVIGVPLPGVIFHLEDGQWVDFVVPCPGLNWLINVGLSALCGAVVAALAMGRRRPSGTLRGDGQNGIGAAG